jgi:hypothetical protein
MGAAGMHLKKNEKKGNFIVIVLSSSQLNIMLSFQKKKNENFLVDNEIKIRD